MGRPLVTLLILAYASGWLERFRGSVSPGEIRALAVMPFGNLSGDPGQEYFTDGVTDALITELGKIRALRIISRQSVMRYKGMAKPLPEIAGELKVDTVLEGTVQRDGDRVRITAQVVRAKPEEHLWAESYERPYGDVLALQSEIARDVARQVKATLAPEEGKPMTRGRPANPEALEAYLRGKYFFHRRSRESLRKAIESYETATRLDPGFALAWAALSPAYGVLGYWGYAAPREMDPKAKAAALKAIELDPTLAEGHLALAQAAAIAEWDWATAEKEFLRAIELNPNHVEPRVHYGLVLGSLRRPKEALAQLEAARQGNPYNPVPICLVGWCSYISGQFEKAARQAREAVELEPGFFYARWFFWRFLHRVGDEAAAYQECRRMYELLGDAEIVEALERGHRKSGYRGAMAGAAETLARRSGSTYVPGTQVALLYAHAGENDRALEWLEKAAEERDGRIHGVWADPDWEQLYSRPRFQALLRKMGFPSVEKPAAWTRPRQSSH